MNTMVQLRPALWQVLPPPDLIASQPLAQQLERATAMLREAVHNQELTGLMIGAQRLYALAHAARFGPLAWHAAAIAAMCADRPDDTTRLSELMAGVELALGAANLRLDATGGA